MGRVWVTQVPRHMNDEKSYHEKLKITIPLLVNSRPLGGGVGTVSQILLPGLFGGDQSEIRVKVYIYDIDDLFDRCDLM